MVDEAADLEGEEAAGEVELPPAAVFESGAQSTRGNATWILAIATVLVAAIGVGAYFYDWSPAEASVDQVATEVQALPLQAMASEGLASMDGDSQQQSWCNAARAIAAAARYAQPDATIVLWSAIDDPPSGQLLNLADARVAADPGSNGEPLEEDFPPWVESTVTARTIARIAADHRLLIHSRLEEETIESMGLASIESVEELTRLSRTFNTCGVLRAAQFAGTTIDTTHQLA